MTSRKMPLLGIFFFIYITICWINTVVNTQDFDSNVFIFWSKMDVSPKERVKINNFFCMGVVLHIQWILTPRVCFENSIQLTQPETFSVVPMMNQNTFDERKVKSSQIFEVQHVLLNVTRSTDSGFVILKLKDENLFAKNITKFISSTRLERQDICTSLMWGRVSNNKYIIKPKIYKASKSDSCQTLGIGDVCVTSNITGMLCNALRSSMLQCRNQIQGISGYEINTDVVCRSSNKNLSVIYVDFSEHIFHIVLFLLSEKESEASYLSCSKVLILTAVIISTHHLIQTVI